MELKSVLHLLQRGLLHLHTHAQQPLVAPAIDVRQVRLRILQRALADGAVISSLLYVAFVPTRVCHGKSAVVWMEMWVHWTRARRER